LIGSHKLTPFKEFQLTTILPTFGADLNPLAAAVRFSVEAPIPNR